MTFPIHGKKMFQTTNQDFCIWFEGWISNWTWLWYCQFKPLSWWGHASLSDKPMWDNMTHFTLTCTGNGSKFAPDSHPNSCKTVPFVIPSGRCWGDGSKITKPFRAIGFWSWSAISLDMIHMLWPHENTRDDGFLITWYNPRGLSTKGAPKSKCFSPDLWTHCKACPAS